MMGLIYSWPGLGEQRLNLPWHNTEQINWGYSCPITECCLLASTQALDCSLHSNPTTLTVTCPPSLPSSVGWMWNTTGCLTEAPSHSWTPLRPLSPGMQLTSCVWEKGISRDLECVSSLLSKQGAFWQESSLTHWRPWERGWNGKRSPQPKVHQPSFPPPVLCDHWLASHHFKNYKGWAAKSFLLSDQPLN